MKRALEFAWVPGGWDANRDGVLEGVQHNTYDVEFYGPIRCAASTIWARCGPARRWPGRPVKTNRLPNTGGCLRAERTGSIREHFNGEYYVQTIEGRPADAIAKGLRSGMGADDPEHPQFQVGTVVWWTNLWDSIWPMWRGSDCSWIRLTFRKL